MSQKVTKDAVVTAADRDAAWQTRPEPYDERTKAAWDSGVYDKTRHIQSYAQHRVASEARHLKLIAKLNDKLSKTTAQNSEIAAELARIKSGAEYICSCGLRKSCNHNHEQAF